MNVCSESLSMANAESNELIEEYPIQQISLCVTVDDDAIFENLLIFTTKLSQDKVGAIHLFQCRVNEVNTCYVEFWQTVVYSSPVLNAENMPENRFWQISSLVFSDILHKDVFQQCRKHGRFRFFRIFFKKYAGNRRICRFSSDFFPIQQTPVYSNLHLFE